MKKLPNKPSELIKVALADLAKCERSKKYVIEMGNWHVLRPNNKCEVCFAGAVMAKTLKLGGISLDADWVPRNFGCHFDEDTASKLYALDDLRTGDIAEALDVLKVLEVPSSARALVTEGMEVCDYRKNKAQFKRDMNRLAKELSKYGL